MSDDEFENPFAAMLEEEEEEERMMEEELAEIEKDGAGELEEIELTRYKVIRKAAIRAGFGKTSKKLDRVLAVGETIIVEARRTLGTTMRLMFDDDLWTSQNSEDGTLMLIEEGKENYFRCKKESTVRTARELDSKKVGPIESGRVIEAVEEYEDEKENIRVRFGVNGGGGWVSIQSIKSGDLLFIPVDYDDFKEKEEEPEPEVSPEPEPEAEVAEEEDEPEEAGTLAIFDEPIRYRVMKKTIVRAGFRKNTEKSATYKPGKVIKVKACRPLGAAIRLNTADGWISERGENGDQIVISEKIDAYYQCEKATTVREGFAMDSKKLDLLEKSTVVQALEAKPTEDGTVRIRYEGGWVSLKSAQTGDDIMQKIKFSWLVADDEAESIDDGGDDDNESDEEYVGDIEELDAKFVIIKTTRVRIEADRSSELVCTLPVGHVVDVGAKQEFGNCNRLQTELGWISEHGKGGEVLMLREGVEYYKCVKDSQVRDDSALDSAKSTLLDKLLAGTVIECLESVELEGGVKRVCFSKGWVSDKTQAGVALLETISYGIVVEKANAAKKARGVDIDETGFVFTFKVTGNRTVGIEWEMASKVNRVMASTVEGGGMEDMVVIRAIQDKSMAHGVQGLCAGMVLKEISGVEAKTRQTVVRETKKAGRNPLVLQFMPDEANEEAPMIMPLDNLEYLVKVRNKSKRNRRSSLRVSEFGIQLESKDAKKAGEGHDTVAYPSIHEWKVSGTNVVIALKNGEEEVIEASDRTQAGEIVAAIESKKIQMARGEELGMADEEGFEVDGSMDEMNFGGMF